MMQIIMPKKKLGRWEPIGEITHIIEDESGVNVFVEFHPNYEWLLDKQGLEITAYSLTKPQNRLEGRPWWYPFTRIKKLLSRS